MNDGWWVRRISRKHPGAVFLKRRGTRDDFVCKVYAGHDDVVDLIRLAPAMYLMLKDLRDRGCIYDDGDSMDNVNSLIDAIENRTFQRNDPE